MQFHNIHEQSYSLKCFLWLYLFVGNNDKFPHILLWMKVLRVLSLVN